MTDDGDSHPLDSAGAVSCRRWPGRAGLMAVLVLAALLGGCGSGDETTAPTTDAGSTSSSAGSSAGEDLPVVLVTNDDGYAAEGIDALVQALVARGDVEVVVAAPAEDQSGSGGKTTDGELVATDAETASGYPAKAVEGFPADSVRWALGEGGIEPDLVISGINAGQNLGVVVDISGTVGAARQAAQLGVPAVATSQGLADPIDYPSGVDATMRWLDENFEALEEGTLGTEVVININTPTCTTGEVQGVVEVPVNTDAETNQTDVDCAGAEEPVDDVIAFVNGWIALSEVEPTGSYTG